MRIRIRELSMLDALTINRWHNDKELFKYLVGNFYGPSIDETKLWISNYLDSNDSTFRGVVSNGDKDIGIVYLIALTEGESEVGIFIADKKDRGLGYGKEMLSWLISFGFSVLKLNKISLYTLESNKQAIKLYQSCGFVIDSNKNKIVTKNNKKQNVIYMYLNKD